MELLHIKSCTSSQDKELSGYFENVISSLDIYNVFNPSFYCDENVKIFAFRAILKGSKELSSFISIEDQKCRSIKNISTDFHKELGSICLIDPKIAQINGDFYITFNSGWMPKGNDIFIMKIYPEMESPKRILYKNRQKQERNWAFFSEQGDIYALYWLNPLRILKVGRINPKTWEMEEYYSEKEKNNEFPKDLTIGTQLSKLNNKYYFVGHKKIYLWRKKIYF